LLLLEAALLGEGGHKFRLGHAFLSHGIRFSLGWFLSSWPDGWKNK
jgi:hypothetical protein